MWKEWGESSSQSGWQYGSMQDDYVAWAKFQPVKALPGALVKTGIGIALLCAGPIGWLTLAVWGAGNKIANSKK